MPMNSPMTRVSGVNAEETHISRVWGFPPSRVYTPRARRSALRFAAL